MKTFADKIIEWNKLNLRYLPWKIYKEAYPIWLSEIIMQQTRVEQGTPYFEKFISQYPTVFDLAKANDKDVFKIWEGLGYYNRCKNMLETARFIVANFNGIFPSTYSELIKLKGIGEYTAAAIASFAFDENIAAIDGNAKRVLARYFGIEYDIQSIDFMKLAKNISSEIMPIGKSALYNQAMMNFGAMMCKIRNPLCNVCPLHLSCFAYRNNKILNLPMTTKSKTKKNRNLNYIVYSYNNEVFIKQRNEKDIWNSLYEFYEVMPDENLNSNKIQAFLKKNDVLFSDFFLLGKFKHLLTHQSLNIEVYMVKINNKFEDKNGLWIEKNELSNFAFPIILANKVIPKIMILN